MSTCGMLPRVCEILRKQWSWLMGMLSYIGIYTRYSLYCHKEPLSTEYGAKS